MELFFYEKGHYNNLIKNYIIFETTCTFDLKINCSRTTLKNEKMLFVNKLEVLDTGIYFLNSQPTRKSTYLAH